MSRRTMLVLLGACSLALFISMLSAGYALNARLSLTNDRRQQQYVLNREFKRHDERQTAAWHQVLCDARAETLKAKTLSQAQKRASVRFYDKELHLVGAKPCVGGGT